MVTSIGGRTRSGADDTSDREGAEPPAPDGQRHRWARNRRGRQAAVGIRWTSAGVDPQPAYARDTDVYTIDLAGLAHPVGGHCGD